MDRTELTRDRYQPPETPGQTAGEPRSSVEGEQSPEPSAAVGGPAGLRRLRVSHPPMERGTAGPSPALVGLFPTRDPAAASPPSASTTADSDPVPLELLGLPLFAAAPPKAHQPSTAPPTAWKSVTTVSVLRSILPPAGPLVAPTPLEPPVATGAEAMIPAARLQPVAEALAPALPFAPTPVADIRARFPGSAPRAAATAATAAVVAVGPWPAETGAPAGARTEAGSALRPSVGKRSVPRRILWTLLRVALAAVATAVLYVAASGLLNC